MNFVYMFNLKRLSKKQLQEHFGFFASLFIPWWLTNLSVVYVFHSFSLLTIAILPISIICIFLRPFFLISASLECLMSVRFESDYENGFQKNLNIFANHSYLFGVIFVGLLKLLRLLLWNSFAIACIYYAWFYSPQLNTPILFVGIVFGVIISIYKLLSYSQAQFIYRDSLISGKQLSYNQAISISVKLMKHKKNELIRLYLSFIPWYFLSVLTVGFSAIYSTPYIELSMARYYDELLRNYRLNNSNKWF